MDNSVRFTPITMRWIRNNIFVKSLTSYLFQWVIWNINLKLCISKTRPAFLSFLLNLCNLVSKTQSYLIPQTRKILILMMNLSLMKEAEVQQLFLL